MADIPIIFSAPMVQALLAGRKTMTRRLAWQDIPDPADSMLTIGRKATRWQAVRPGDRLWVKEAWAAPGGYDSMKPSELPRTVRIFYGNDINISGRGRPRALRFMPRWASRITLTLTATRVERLQEITYEDVTAEGIETRQFGATTEHEGFRTWRHPDGRFTPHARAAFRQLWDSLHGPGAWDANPEVVALSFTVAQHNIDHPPRSTP